jgi:hypothetical protein
MEGASIALSMGPSIVPSLVPSIEPSVSTAASPFPPTVPGGSHVDPDEEVMQTCPDGQIAVAGSQGAPDSGDGE